MIQARYELLRLKGWENRGKFERGTSGIRSQTGLGRSWNQRDIPRIPETPSHCRQLCPTLTLEELSPVRARSGVAPSHDCNFEIRSSESVRSIRDIKSYLGCTDFLHTCNDHGDSSRSNVSIEARPTCFKREINFLSSGRI